MANTIIKQLKVNDELSYPLAFTLNVMETLQDEYGSFEKWGELVEGKGKNKEPNIKALIFGLTEMINEGLDIEADEKGKEFKPLSTKKVGRILTEIGLETATTQITELVVDSTKSDEKNA